MSNYRLNSRLLLGWHRPVLKRNPVAQAGPVFGHQRVHAVLRFGNHPVQSSIQLLQHL